MVSKQASYEVNGKRIGEEVALDQEEIHDKEEKCKVQDCTRVTILQMTGKKTLHNADQEPYIKVKGSSQRVS